MTHTLYILDDLENDSFRLNQKFKAIKHRIDNNNLNSINYYFELYSECHEKIVEFFTCKDYVESQLSHFSHQTVALSSRLGSIDVKVQDCMKSLKEIILRYRIIFDLHKVKHPNRSLIKSHFVQIQTPLLRLKDILKKLKEAMEAMPPEIESVVVLPSIEEEPNNHVRFSPTVTRRRY